jgi:hypothetical protein
MLTEPVADLWDALAAELAPKALALADPVALFRSAGLEPDPAQVEVLTTSAPRVILNWARQSGKTTAVACRAAWLCQARPGSTAVICAGRQEQAKHLLRACRRFSGRGSSATGTATELTIRYANGSEILVVPASDTARGLTAHLLIVEEAAVVPDDVYDGVLTPMVSTTHGPIILLGTPGSEVGSFFDIWSAAPRWDPAKPASEHSWLKLLRAWQDCPRIDPWTVAELRERQPRAYRREYLCEFAGSDSAVFLPEIVASMADESVEPLNLLDSL